MIHIMKKLLIKTVMKRDNGDHNYKTIIMLSIIMIVFFSADSLICNNTTQLFDIMYISSE
jgi:hypothetical protein